jgi:hypothetical protein
VVINETFFPNVRTEMNRVHEFLGLPPIATVPEWINSARVLRWRPAGSLLRPPRRNALVARAPARIRRAAVGLLYSKDVRRETLNPATRVTLAKYYAPHNQRLEELLGVDLSTWQDEARDASVERRLVPEPQSKTPSLGRD